MREKTFDVLKGIGIIMMVAFHARAPYCIRHFGCLFHMAVFFILAGWFFDLEYSKDSTSVIRYVKKRILRLWWPLCLWGGVFMLLHNVFIDWHLISDLGVDVPVPPGYQCPHWDYNHFLKHIARIPLTLANSAPLGGALWFVQTLFFASCGYCVVTWIIRKVGLNVPYAQTCVSAAFLLAGQYSPWPLFRACDIGRILTAYALIHIGVLLRSKDLKIKRLRPSLQLLVAMASFCILLAMSPLGSVALSSNKFTSCTFLIVCSVSGWYFLLSISSFIENRTLSYIGEHTLPIVIFHFLAFKVVSIVGILAVNDPISKLSEFPVCYRGGMWWVLYTGAGVALPLAANFCYISTRRFLRQKLTGSKKIP